MRAFTKSNARLLISDINHSPVILVSERDCMTIGIDFFKELIIKTTVTLYKFRNKILTVILYRFL